MIHERVVPVPFNELSSFRKRKEYSRTRSWIGSRSCGQIAFYANRDSELAKRVLHRLDRVAYYAIELRPATICQQPRNEIQVKAQPNWDLQPMLNAQYL